jgi:hypothetical protein
MSDYVKAVEALQQKLDAVAPGAARVTREENGRVGVRIVLNAPEGMPEAELEQMLRTELDKLRAASRTPLEASFRIIPEPPWSGRA